MRPATNALPASTLLCHFLPATPSGVSSEKWWVFLSRECVAPPHASTFPCWLSRGAEPEHAWSGALLSRSGLDSSAAICTHLGLKSSYVFPPGPPLSSESDFEEDIPYIV